MPSDYSDNSGIITILTYNYQNTSMGGAVQLLVSKNNFYRRIANTETAYTSWVKIAAASEVVSLTDYEKYAVRGGGVVVNSEDKFAAPYDDADTLPIGSVVTYIGADYFPSNIPANCAPTGLFTILTYNWRNNNMSGAVQLLVSKESLFWRYSVTGTEYTSWVSPQTSYSSVSYQMQNENLMALFETVGVVGDSYASGAISVGGATAASHYSVSWPQIMARRNGISCTNFSKGGLTTRTWLTDAKGASLLQSESAKNLYILALGINDNALLGTDYLGTSADIDTSDYTANADTFYGNYGRIISMIMEKAPSAKLVISTMAPSAPGSNVAVYNAAIEEIAGIFGIPLLVQGDDHYFTSKLYTSGIVENHPLASGYAHMANAFERMICKAINENQSYFCDYIG